MSQTSASTPLRVECERIFYDAAASPSWLTCSVAEQSTHHLCFPCFWKQSKASLASVPTWGIFTPLKCCLCYVCGFHFPTLWKKSWHIYLCVLITQDNALSTPGAQYSTATQLNMSSVSWPWLACGWELLLKHLLSEWKRECASESMRHGN